MTPNLQTGRPKAVVIGIWILLSGLTGCPSHPLAPEWQGNAQSALKSFTSAYLSGQTRLAEQDFEEARYQIASTGRADLIAKAELVRCATRVASLEFDGCAGFAPIAQDAGAAERSYAAYLTGRWQEVDVALLPPQHRAVASAAAGADLPALLRLMEDPLARLVAAGALLRSGRMVPAGSIIASDTASAQGWRRPLLAWLGVQLRGARQAGDSATVLALERRIALATSASN